MPEEPKPIGPFFLRDITIATYSDGREIKIEIITDQAGKPAMQTREEMLLFSLAPVLLQHLAALFRVANHHDFSLSLLAHDHPAFIPELVATRQLLDRLSQQGLVPLPWPTPDPQTTEAP
jgi:hypothetical protein